MGSGGVELAVDIEQLSAVLDELHGGTVHRARIVRTVGPARPALPFTATLDADARLTKLIVHSPAIGKRPADDLIVTFTGFGEQCAQQKPAGTLIEA